MSRRNEINIFAWDDDDDFRTSTKVIKPKILNLCNHSSEGSRTGQESLIGQANQELQNILVQSLNVSARKDWIPFEEEWRPSRANLFTPPPPEPRPSQFLSKTACTPPIAVPTPPVRAANPMALNSPFAYEDFGIPEGAELGLLSLSPPFSLFRDDVYSRSTRGRALTNDRGVEPQQHANQAASSLICGTA